MENREARKLLYAAVEKSVATKSQLIFPEEVIGYSITVGSNYYLLPDLFWMDERRNVYQVWLRAEDGLRVVGSCTPDGMSSGDLSMIKQENRYKTII